MKKYDAGEVRTIETSWDRDGELKQMDPYRDKAVTFSYPSLHHMHYWNSSQQISILPSHAKSRRSNKNMRKMSVMSIFLAIKKINPAVD